MWESIYYKFVRGKYYQNVLTHEYIGENQYRFLLMNSWLFLPLVGKYLTVHDIETIQ